MHATGFNREARDGSMSTEMGASGRWGAGRVGGGGQIKYSNWNSCFPRGPKSRTHLLKKHAHDSSTHGGMWFLFFSALQGPLAALSDVRGAGAVYGRYRRCSESESLLREDRRRSPAHLSGDRLRKAAVAEGFLGRERTADTRG